MAGRSRMSREAHVRFFEGLGGKFPRPTRLDSSGQYGDYRSQKQILRVLVERSTPKIDLMFGFAIMGLNLLLICS